MQRYIMKHGTDSLFSKIPDQSCADLHIMYLNIIHMCIMNTFLRHKWLLYFSLCCQMCQISVVILINFHTFIINLLPFLKLGKEIRCVQFTWKIGGTIIHPAVFIHLSTEELASVCSLFPEDFCFLLISVIIVKQSSALSHGIILSLMETVTSKITNSSKCLSLVECIHTLGSILHYLQSVLSGNLHDRVHLTGNSCIMNRYDHLCSVSNRLLDQLLIHIHGIRSDIHKYNLRLP